MRVVVTGGSGMVGRNLMEHPSAAKHEILAPRRAELDLLNADAVDRYLHDVRPDFVIHAAGRVGGIQANTSDPVAFLVENSRIGLNVIDAARKAGVRQLLNLGSSCMYPREATNPLRESSILTGLLEPTNEGYALAKITAARLCEYTSRQYPDCSFKTLIPCNLYGRHDAFAPERSHLVPSIIRKIHDAKAKSLPTVDIWGTGEARREFMYAGELADCVFLAIDNFADLPDIANVGVGEDHTVNEYYETVAGIIGYTGTFTHDLSKPVGMSQKLVDTTRINNWGWRTRMKLREGLLLTYKYYCAQVLRINA